MASSDFPARPRSRLRADDRLRGCAGLASHRRAAPGARGGRHCCCRAVRGSSDHCGSAGPARPAAAGNCRRFVLLREGGGAGPPGGPFCLSRALPAARGPQDSGRGPKAPAASPRVRLARWRGWCPPQHPRPRLYLLPSGQGCPTRCGAHFSVLADALRRCGCRGVRLHEHPQGERAWGQQGGDGGSWGFTPGTQEGPLPCGES